VAFVCGFLLERPVERVGDVHCGSHQPILPYLWQFENMILAAKRNTGA
jgi:hypothetical protein